METVAKQDNNIADNSQVIILIENGKKNINEKYYSDYLNKISDICTVLIHNLDKEKKKQKIVGVNRIKEIRNIAYTLHKKLPKLLSSKKKKWNGDPESRGFGKKKRITEECAIFLQKPYGTTMSQLEITRAINTYINRKNGKSKTDRCKFEQFYYLNPMIEDAEGKSVPSRDLQNTEKKICVTLDDTLKKLLQYDEYIKKVRNGDIYVSVKNKDTGIKTKEVTYDENIYYYSLQLLVQCLFEKKNV